MEQGILVIGHGSRAKEAQNIFQSIVAKLRARGFEDVEGVHMELAKPNIQEGVQKLVNKGVKTIVAVPLFIYSGIHIQEDIPQLLQEVGKQYSEVTFKMGQALGDDDLIVDLLQKRVNEALVL